MVNAQLDTVHYIPPMHSRLTGEIEDHYVYISTPETTPFLVNVVDGSGTEFPGSPFSLSNSNPVTIYIGNGEIPSTQLMVGFGDLNQVLTNKGLILSGEKKFYANARYRSNSQAEALTSKGRASAGTEFRLGMMPVPSENSFRNFVVGIMAIQDGTIVDVSDYNPGVVFDGPSPITADNLTINLNAGDCYVLSGYMSTTANFSGMIGALVESNKPIVINAGNMCGTIGPASGGQDMALDQIVPVNKIGNKYILVEGQGVSEQERPMVVAHFDNTQVYLNGSGTPVTTLNAGDWYLINNNAYSGAAHKNMYIYVSEPAYVFQFLAGSTSNTTPGMNFMPPVDCSLPKEVDQIPQVEKIGDVSYTGGILVITETGSTLTLNGVPQGGAQSVAGNSDWETYKILNLTGDVAVNSTGGLAVGIYGQSGVAGFAGFYAGFSSVLDVVVSNDTSFCVQDAALVTIVAEADGGFPPYTFNWNQGLGQGAEHTVFATTTTEYIVTVTDNTSCTSTDKVVITINDPPILTMTPDESICEGEGTIIEAGTNGSAEPLSYNWNQGLGNSASHEVFPTDYTQYLVTVTDANGCSSTGEIDISVNPIPSTIITGDSLVCEGSGALLDAGDGFVNYNWSSGESAQVIVPGNTGNYTVTVTDQNNCTATDDIYFEFSLNPVVLAGPDQTICLGENTLLVGEAYGGVEPYTYAWDQGLGGGYIHLVDPDETTTYSLTVVDNLGCVGMDAVTINVVETEPVDITGDTELCEGLSTTLDAGDGFVTYTWNTGDVGQILVTDLPGIYIVEVQDQNGCFGMDSINVVVQDSLQPVISGILNICDGQSAVLDAGGGYDQYIWNTGEEAQSIMVSDAGSYSVTVTNAAGCSGSYSVETNTFEAPDVTLPAETSICAGDSIWLVANASSGEGPYTFSWNGGLAYGDTLAISPPGDSSFSVLVTDVNGCMDSTSMNVLVNTLPVADAGADQQICFGDTVMLEAAASSGTQPYNYAWDQGLGIGESQEITPLISTQYSLTITDAAGCQGYDSVQINVSDEIIASIGGQTNFCFGNSSTLSVPSGYIGYAWSTGDTTSSIMVDQSGNYSLTISDEYGCTLSDEVDVVVQDSLTPQINADISLCIGDTIELTVEGGYDTYNWNTGETTENILISQGGAYSITVSNADGCNGSDIITVDEHDLPVIMTSEDDSICAGYTTILSALGTNGTEPYEYMWDQGLGIGESHLILPSQSTIYTVTVTDSAGCSDEASINITVLPTPIAAFYSDDDGCVGEKLFVSFEGTNIPGAEFNWDFGPASVVSDTANMVFGLTFPISGIFEISLIINQNGCVDASQQTIVIHPNNIEETTVDACDIYSWNGEIYTESGTYTFDGQNQFGCDSTHNLILNIHASYDTLIQQIVCDENEVGTETFTLSTEFGCDSIVTEEYFLGPELSVDLGQDISVLFGEEVFIQANVNGAIELIDTVYWSGIPGNSCPNCLDQNFSAQDSGMITVYIVDINGCLYSDALTISVQRSKGIYAPNVFSPNNDGVNDFFNLFGDLVKFKRINYLMIYDRWGNNVFGADDILPNQMNTGWDGRFHGKALNPGVYVWYAEVLFDDGTTELHQGDVMLIR